MWNTTYERELRAHRRNRQIGKAILVVALCAIIFAFGISALVFLGCVGSETCGGADFWWPVHWPLKLLQLL